MLTYQWSMALRSMAKSPWLCGFVVLMLGVGVALCMVSYTAHHAIQGNPMLHKTQLHYVQTNSWSLGEPYMGAPRNNIPSTLSYRDVRQLMSAQKAPRQVAVAGWGGTIAKPSAEQFKPKMVFASIVSRDYFQVFDRPFLFGGPWEASADTANQQQVVLSERMNRLMFDGRNSLGEQILFEGKSYQVVGVLADQGNRINNVENVYRGNMTPGEALFPLGIIGPVEVTPWGPKNCPKDAVSYDQGYQAFLDGACSWIGFWVDFDSEAQKTAFSEYLRQYIEAQKPYGFYPRPTEFAVTPISEVMTLFRYDSSIFQLTFSLGIGILLVCVANAVAMFLAKFMRQAPECGVRRAMGASQGSIFAQHILESGLLGVLGALTGIVFTLIGLWIMRHSFNLSFPGPIEGMGGEVFGQMLVMDGHVMLVALCLSLGASLLAGVYPAWRICRTPAALYLKQQ